LIYLQSFIQSFFQRFRFYLSSIGHSPPIDRNKLHCTVFPFFFSFGSPPALIRTSDSCTRPTQGPSTQRVIAVRPSLSKFLLSFHHNHLLKICRNCIQIKHAIGCRFCYPRHEKRSIKIRSQLYPNVERRPHPATDYRCADEKILSI
jgi:hypothetical protein